MQLRFSSLGVICRGVRYTVSLNFDQLAVYNLLQINLTFCKVALQLQSFVLSMKLNYFVKIRRVLYFCWCHLLINTAPGLTVADCACVSIDLSCCLRKTDPWAGSLQGIVWNLCWNTSSLDVHVCSLPVARENPTCVGGVHGAAAFWSHSIAWW